MIHQIAFYNILGLPLIAYGGIITLLCILATATMGYMIHKNIRRIPIKWHLRMAAISIVLGLFHGLIAMLAFLGF